MALKETSASDSSILHRPSQRDSTDTSRTVVSLLYQAIVAIAAIITVTLMKSIHDPERVLFALSWASNVLFIGQALLLRRAFGSFSLPAPLFSALLALFTCGQTVLFSLGVDPVGADVINRENHASITLALEFFIIAYAFFGIGLLIARIRSVAGDREKRSTVARADWQLALTRVGLFLAIIGFLPFIISNLDNLQIVWSSGYSNYYVEGARISTPALGLGYYFITGLVFMACSGSRRTRHLSIAALTLVAALRLASGDRGDGMIYLLTAYVLWMVASEGANRARGRLVAFGVAGAAVVAIPAIGVLRHSISSTPGNWRQAFAIDNPLIETLRNLGITLHPLVKTVELTPQVQPFLGGSSYVGAVAMTVPSELRVGWLGSATADVINTSPGTWLMETLNMSYGPGFTPFAEAYLNFGPIWGVAALIAFGLLMGSLLHTPDWCQSHGPIRLAVAMTCFALLGFTVRGSFNIIPMFSLRYVLIPLLLVTLLAHTQQRKRIRAEGDTVAQLHPHQNADHH